MNRNKNLSVAIIGSGFAGMCAAIKLKEAGIENFVIFEKGNQVGGTWRDNTYPGCACDVRAMLYSYSFEINKDWSREYPRQPEIFSYLQGCASKYDLYRHIRFNEEVSKAHFDDLKGCWQISLRSGEEMTTRFLISGTGQLNRPFTPDLKGKNNFKGASFHSARYDHSVDLRGKSVAVIGNGASALQIVPEIAPVVRQMKIYQRSANWIIPRGDRPYSLVEKLMLKYLPGFAEFTRFRIWAQNELHWPILLASGNSLLRTAFENIVLGIMKSKISDPALQKKLTPDYPAGCKRVLISDDYYPALNRPNIDVETSHISEISPDGILTKDGKHHGHDVIIYCTGFRSSELLSPIEIYGQDGLSINQAWAMGAEAYLGVSVPKFPNFFILYGPNTNLGHNSIVFMIERQVNHIMQLLKRAEEKNLKQISVTQKAMDAWRDECQAQLEKTVWSQNCNSWYKNEHGRITNNWPYSTFTYLLRMHEVNFADYIEEPQGRPNLTLV